MPAHSYPLSFLLYYRSGVIDLYLLSATTMFPTLKADFEQMTPTPAVLNLSMLCPKQF